MNQPGQEPDHVVHPALTAKTPSPRGKTKGMSHSVRYLEAGLDPSELLERVCGPRCCGCPFPQNLLLSGCQTGHVSLWAAGVPWCTRKAHTTEWRGGGQNWAGAVSLQPILGL